MSPRVLFVAAEALPLAKTGGLGDVVSALAAALQARGIDVTILLPGYGEALERTEGLRHIGVLDDLPGGTTAHLLHGHMPDTDVPVLLLRRDELFVRSGGPYLDEHGNEYPDNAARFGTLCKAAATIASGGSRLATPHIVHIHDWHAGLVPLYLRGVADAPQTALTIHNLAFQGNFPMTWAETLGLPPDTFNADGVEFWNQLSFLKAGIRYANRVTTVSESYAAEILTPQFGCGMEGLLGARGDRIVAVANGIDTDVWDPAIDHLIAAPFSVDDMRGKLACKKVLQQTFGLRVEPFAPILALGSRLTTQKMGDVALETLRPLLHDHERLQVAVLGNGDADLEDGFKELARAFEGRVGVIIGYDEKTAHSLHAGADMLLHGSRFEPFGLTPVYAMRYGTVPIGSRVGGLIDTIIDRGLGDEADPRANGFLFEGETSADMLSSIGRALDSFERPREWRALQRQGMSGEYGWDLSADRYIALYRAMTSGASQGAFGLAAQESAASREAVSPSAKKRA